MSFRFIHNSSSYFGEAFSFAVYQCRTSRTSKLILCSSVYKPYSSSSHKSILIANSIICNKKFSECSKMPVIPVVIAHRRQKQYQEAQKRVHYHHMVATQNNNYYVSSANNNNNECLETLKNHEKENSKDKGQHKITKSSSTVDRAGSGLTNKSCLLDGGHYANLLDLNQFLKPLLYGKECRRFYAKGRDKPKSAKKANVVINENEMSMLIDPSSLTKNLEQLLVQMKDEYARQLSVRGAAGALETLQVEYEGETYPLQELAQVGRKNPQLAVLNMATLPDAIQPVLKAIQESGMNLSPQQEGTTIYLPLPKVTREHRENLAKNAKAIFVKYKTALQTVQNRFIKQCKSQKDASEDLIFSVSNQIVKMTENYIADADKLLQSKTKELLDT